jgi:glucokinase
MDSFILAADLGGTNLRMAVATPSGHIEYRARSETPESRKRDDIVDAIAAIADECLAAVRARDGKVECFGVAVPAVLDAVRGVVHYSPNLPDLNGLNLKQILTDRTGLEVVIENDANAAAVGEQWLGASKGFDDSICVTLGTGVGGGVISRGRLLRGIDGTAGEIGHVCVEPLGVPCGCGSTGCLEQYSSGTAIERMTKELAGRFPDSVLSTLREVEPLAVFEAGKAGDPLALEVFSRVGYYLGIVFAGLINVLNPEVIVIGGGVSRGWDLFIENTRQQILERAFQQPAERVKLVRAALGDDAGILGAAHLAGRF